MIVHELGWIIDRVWYPVVCHLMETNKEKKYCNKKYHDDIVAWLLSN